MGPQRWCGKKNGSLALESFRKIHSSQRRMMVVMVVTRTGAVVLYLNCHGGLAVNTVIMTVLGWGKLRSREVMSFTKAQFGQEIQPGLNPHGIPCVVCNLTDEVCHDQGQARQNPYFATSGLAQVSCWVRRQWIRCFPLPPIWQEAGLAGRPVSAWPNSAVAHVGKC